MDQRVTVADVCRKEGGRAAKTNGSTSEFPTILTRFIARLPGETRVTDVARDGGSWCVAGAESFAMMSGLKED